MIVRNLDKDPYKGLAKKKGKYIPTGLPTIDNAINELMPSCVSVIVGRTNAGKSTIVRQIIANAISGGNKVFVMNGEGEPEMFINSLYMCVIGADQNLYTAKQVNVRWHKEPNEDALNALKEWHKGKLFLYHKCEDLYSTEDLFTIIDFELSHNNHDLIVIDNLMSMLVAKAIEKNEAQSQFMQQLHEIAVRYNKHIMLVVHPNKAYDKKFDMDIEHISGTSDIGNKADLIISVIREYSEKKLAEGINGKVAVLKNRYYSNLPFCDVHYDVETGMLLEYKMGEAYSYNFKLSDHLTVDTEAVMPFDL